jgi:hypothetical protein
MVKRCLVVAMLLVPTLLLADSPPGRLKVGYQRWSARDCKAKRTATAARARRSSNTTPTTASS